MCPCDRRTGPARSWSLPSSPPRPGSVSQPRSFKILRKHATNGKFIPGFKQPAATIPAKCLQREALSYFWPAVFADALGAMTLFFCVIFSRLSLPIACLLPAPLPSNVAKAPKFIAAFSPLFFLFFFLFIVLCVGAGGSPAARTPTPAGLRETLESSYACALVFSS